MIVGIWERKGGKQHDLFLKEQKKKEEKRGEWLP